MAMPKKPYRMLGASMETSCLSGLTVNNCLLAPILRTLCVDFEITPLREELWADSICINQADEYERSKQVRKMGEVYAGAQRVPVWIGKDCDNLAQERIHTIPTVNAYFCELSRIGDIISTSQYRVSRRSFPSQNTLVNGSKSLSSCPSSGSTESGRFKRVHGQENAACSGVITV